MNSSNNKSRIVHKYHSYDFGNNLTYSIDLHTNIINIDKELIKINNDRFPLYLSIKYNSSYYNTNIIYTNQLGNGVNTYLPYGWHFNYQEYLKFDSSNNKYFYYDNNLIVHEFLYNGSYYYDTLGTGLIIKIVDQYKQLIDIDSNISNFDIYGRIVNKSYHLNTNNDNNSSFCKIYFHYDENNIYKLNRISDSLNNNIMVAYNINDIIISLHSNNQFIKQIRLVTSNNKLNNIEDNSEVCSFTYSTNIDTRYRITRIQSNLRRRLDIAYSENDNTDIIELQYKHNNILIDKYIIETHKYYTILKQRGINSDIIDSNKYIVYSYDNEDNFTSSYSYDTNNDIYIDLEYNDNNIKYNNLKIIDNTLYRKVKSIHYFTEINFNGETSIVNTSNIAISNSLNINEVYALKINYKLLLNEINDNDYFKIQVIQGIKLINEINLAIERYNTNDEKNVIVRLPIRFNNLTDIKIRFISNIDGSINLKELGLYKVINSKALCSNISTSQEYNYEFNNTNYYLLNDKVNISYYSLIDNHYHMVPNINLTYSDLFNIKKSFNGETYILYTNHLENNLGIVSDLVINENEITDYIIEVINEKISINENAFIQTKTLNEIIFNNSFNSSITILDYSIYENVLYTVMNTYNKFGLLILQKDEFDNYIEHTYNIYFERLKTERYHYDTGKEIDSIENYTFNNGLLASELKYYGINDYIVSNVFIDYYNYTLGLNNISAITNTDNGIEKYKQDYTYDLNGRIVENKIISNNNYQKINLEYNSKSKINKITSSDSVNNHIYNNNEYKYFYNTNNELEEIKQDDDSINKIEYARDISFLDNDFKLKVINHYDTYNLNKVIAHYYDYYDQLIYVVLEDLATFEYIILKTYIYGYNVLDSDIEEIIDPFDDRLHQNPNSLLLKEIDNMSNKIKYYKYDIYNRLYEEKNNFDINNYLYDDQNRLNINEYIVRDSSIYSSDIKFTKELIYDRNTSELVKNKIQYTIDNQIEYIINSEINKLYNKIINNKYTFNYLNNRSIIDYNYTYKSFSYIDRDDCITEGSTNIINSISVNLSSNNQTHASLTDIIDYNSSKLDIKHINRTIFRNGNIENKNINFKYDGYNQLIEEEYSNTNKISYSYVNGNRTNKKIYSFNNNTHVYELLNEIIYDYHNDNKIYTIEKYDNDGDLLNTFTYQYSNNDKTVNIYLDDDLHITYNFGNEYNNYNKLINYIDQYNNVSYNYNSDGLRIEKINNNIKHIYKYNDDNLLICERIVDLNNLWLKKIINYIYDSNNKLISIIIKINNNSYRYNYIYDSLNNIIALSDIYNNIILEYNYDSYGNIISYIDNSNINLFELNPFIYKGYYYDNETGLYWLSSRYYDPEIGTFISPDSVDYLDPTSINGLNLYAYCNNDPVNYCDPSGHAPKWWQIAFGVGLGIIIVAAAICTAGAIIAAAPAIAGYVSTTAIAYTGSLALASGLSTAVSIGAGALAIGTIAIGINDGVYSATGFNTGVTLLGEEVYSALASTISFGGYIYITGGAMLPYPSTGKSPSNLKEQLVLEEASSNPSSGKVIKKHLDDSRFPSWLGWQKYSFYDYEVEVHYVGNRFFPSRYPYSPWFDYKIK